MGRCARALPTTPPQLPSRLGRKRTQSVSDLRVAVFALSALILFLAATAQAALVYIDRARLRHMIEEGTPRANALLRLLDEPSSSLATILFVHTLSLCVAAGSAFWLDLDIWWLFAPWAAIA